MRLPRLGWVVIGIIAACGDDDDDDMDATADAGPVEATYLHELDDLTDVDLAASSEAVVIDGGRARLAPRYLLIEDAGTGAEGAYAPSVAGELTAGTHELSSLVIDGVAVTSPGDLTLLVDGPFTVRGGGRLAVAGTLTIVVTGALHVECSAIVSASQLAIHQPTTSGIRVDCPGPDPGRVTVSPGDFGAPLDGTGYLDVRTRGPVTLTNAQLGSTDGWVSLRTGQAVILDSRSSVTSGEGFAVWIETESRVQIANDSELRSPSADPDTGDGVLVRAVGSVDLYQESDLVAGNGGDVEVFAGDFSLENEATLVADDEVRVEAGNVRVGGHAAVRSGDGDIEIVSADGVGMQFLSSIEAGAATCMEGGSVRIRAAGAVTLTGDATVRGGASQASDGCAAGAGGSVLIESGGAIEVTGTPGNEPFIQAGAGATPGTVTTTPNADVDVVVDPGVATRAVLQSVALPLEAVAGEVIQVESLAERGVLTVAADGVTFGPPEDATLADGWKWRVELAAGLFDAAWIDGFSIVYGVR